MVLTLPVFWIVHLVGVLYSDNMSYWGLDIEVKLSFFVAPILLLLLYKPLRKYWSYLLIAFFLGVFAKSIYLLDKAYQCLELTSNQRNCFESSVFAGDYHTTYIATLFLLAILFLWVLFLKIFRNWLMLTVAIICSAYFSYFIYQFYAIGPWVSMIILALFSIFYFIPVKKWWVYPLAIGALAFGLNFMVKSMDLTASGYNAVQKEFASFNQNPEKYLEKNKNDTQSIKARILLWYVSSAIIKKHPIGVGNGDTKDVLIAKYKQLGMTNYAEKKLNPHNQFLQTTIALGWLSGIYLLFIGIYAIYTGFKERHFLMLGVAVVFFSGMAFESMLENQAGVIPFAIFFSFIFVIKDSLNFNSST